MIKSIQFLFFLGIISIGCAENPSRMIHNTQQIAGRDDGTHAFSRPALYRAKVPESWRRLDPKSSTSIVDTTKPLCEFIIEEKDKADIRITVHNFPSEGPEDRIPPNAQVARWKRQFTDLDLTTASLLPQSYGGFSGLLFTGTGRLANEFVTMMAWTMQIAPEHYSTLSFHMTLSQTPDQKHFWKQMRADYTIKALGPSTLMSKYRREIVAFAKSFELIQEIPS